uniref:Zinc finger protein-like 1 homolog n=1 Tax=Culicoides sonorensis TaxID=179676 RepID=A0A336M4K7_CULSO
MGLCKCPKRQVTNQFCFDHRVNVCEHCMVRQHNKCIIQSYLQWLKDSDYDSSCKLCGNPLESEDNEKDCVRLICYHVFHWDCLNQFQLSLPSNTAPSGRKCPMCSDPIFPPPNLVSPVCEALRNRLSQVNWGRNELGLPLLSHEKLNTSSFTPTPKESIAQSRKSDFIVGSEAIPRPEVAHSILNIENDIRETRRPLLAREPPIGSSDRDDNKYQRRTPREIFSRWSRRFYAPASRPFYRRTWFQILAGILIFIFVIYLMASIGRRTSSSNPMLDMDMNPNLIQHED